MFTNVPLVVKGTKIGFYRNAPEEGCPKFKLEKVHGLTKVKGRFLWLGPLFISLLWEA